MAFNENIEEYTVKTPAHADEFNKRLDKLVENDKYLKEQVAGNVTQLAAKLDKAGGIMTGDLAIFTDTAAGNWGNSKKIAFDYARYIALEAYNFVFSVYNGQDFIFKDDQKERLRIKSDGSIIANGANLSRFNKGTWSDSSTSIAANSTYTKTIPIGFKAQKGTVVIHGSNNGRFAELFITTNVIDAISIWTATNLRFEAFSKKYNNHLTDCSNGSVFTLNGSIEIFDAYISDSNLIIVFKNTGSSAATLDIPQCIWEVEG